MEPLPKVSIIIPAYNQGHYISETIDGCLAQTHPNIEIIVVNDGSTDNTAEVCAGYGNRIRTINQKNSGMVGYGRNVGILASTGDYFQFLDSDDRILPTKFADQLAAFQAHPEVGLVYSQGYLIDENGVRTGRAEVNHPSGDVFHELLTLWGTLVPAVMIRRECLARVGLFSCDKAIKGLEDADMWLRIALHYPFHSLPETHFEYRVWGNSMSHNAPMMLQAGLEVVRRYSAIHKNCPECRRAARDGRQRWKAVNSYLMMKQAKQCWAQNNRAQALAHFKYVLRHNPAHLRNLLALKSLGGKFRQISGGLPAPASGDQTGEPIK